MTRRTVARAALAALGLGAASLAALVFTARPAPPHPFFQPLQRTPLVIAHADDTGLGLWPGNTMLFLEGVAALGVDVLEMDLHMSRDGHVVLMHDDTVDRTTDGSGLVSDLTLAEIKALEVGVSWTQDGGQTFPYRGRGLRVPTLDEVFERFPDYPMVIEIKQVSPPMGRELCETIRAHRMQDRVIVPSFSDDAIRVFRAACPEVATAASRGEVQTFLPLAMLRLDGALTPAYYALQVPQASGGIPLTTPAFVEAARRRNLQVHVWTVNDPAEMRALIDLGVHGIMTDRPDTLLALLGRAR